MTTRRGPIWKEINYYWAHFGKTCPMAGLFPEEVWLAMITCDKGVLYVTEDASKWPKEVRLHLARAMRRNPNLKLERIAAQFNVIKSEVVDAPTAQLVLEFKRQGRQSVRKIQLPFPWREFMRKPAYNLLVPTIIMRAPPVDQAGIPPALQPP